MSKDKDKTKPKPKGKAKAKSPAKPGGLMGRMKSKWSKEKDLNMELLPPDYFLHSGNYALNKLMTGDFMGGLPQGRLVGLAGHSSSGKSLVAASVVAAVIEDGGFAFVIDSEHALDNDFMRNCGVDVDSGRYQYVGVDGIPQATAKVNEILKEYRDSGETTRGVIMVDSLDMLMTATEQVKLDKDGHIGGDMGQQAKQLKTSLKTWMHNAANLPVTIVCTKQVYVEQDPMKAFEEPWKFTESLKFAFTQIIVFEKLQYRKEVSGKKVHVGFTLKARSYKNRIGREKTVVKVEIPFDNGMDPYSGLIEIAVEYGVIDKNGGWYTPVTFDGPKFQQKKAEADLDFMGVLLEEIQKVNTKNMEVNANLEDYVSDELGEPKPKKRGDRTLEDLQDDLGDDDD